jgi:DNA-binding transcriptional LysR family regulator
MPADWPLAAQPTLRTADLLDGRLMLTDQSCAYRQVIERALLESGTNPYSGIEISSMDALVRAVQGGLGMAIVPVAIASPPPPGTVLKQIEGHQLALPVGLVQRPDDLPPSAALAALITATRSELRAANPTLRSAY